MAQTVESGAPRKKLRILSLLVRDNPCRSLSKDHCHSQLAPGCYNTLKKVLGAGAHKCSPCMVPSKLVRSLRLQKAAGCWHCIVKWEPTTHNTASNPKVPARLGDRYACCDNLRCLSLQGQPVMPCCQPAGRLPCCTDSTSSAAPSLCLPGP